MSLDPADDDEHAFWRTLATALLDIADETAREALRRVTVPGGADLPSLFATGVRMLPHKAVLVLDNLHEVRAPEVHGGLLQLVERPLPTLSLVVITRQDPPWPLQRLRLAGVLSEVRSADLAFRTDEAGLLFGRLGLGLSDAQVNRLVERTEGWAAGLRLAALHQLDCDDVDSAIGAFSGAAHGVAGHLRPEVLDRQTPALLDFLESISAVDQVTAALADALTGGDDGEATAARRRAGPAGDAGRRPAGQRRRPPRGALQASLAGAHERGLDRLEEALLAAAPSRLRRPFLVEAAELRTLLDQRIDRGSAVTAFALDLQRRISGTTVDEPAARRALIDPLTEREQTILSGTSPARCPTRRSPMSCTSRSTRSRPTSAPSTASSVLQGGGTPCAAPEPCTCSDH